MKYVIRGIDAWGNEEEGSEFNDYTTKNIEELDADLADEADDDTIINWLILMNYLHLTTAHYYIENLGHWDGFCVNVCLLDGRPLFEITKGE